MTFVPNVHMFQLNIQTETETRLNHWNMDLITWMIN